MRNYNEYLLSLRQKITAYLFAAAALFAVGWIFYKQLTIACLLSQGALIYPAMYRAALRDKQKKELTLQFKTVLYSLTSSLAAGKSVENSFREMGRDLHLLYPDPTTPILCEIELINKRVNNGEPIELTLVDFSRRSGIDDVRQFADVFVTCKRTGGSLTEVMRRTSAIIGEKLDIEQEISVLVAQKRFESKLLAVIPFVIVGLLVFSSPDYMVPLYGNAAGVAIMTAALFLLLGSMLLTKKIMRMKV